MKYCPYCGATLHDDMAFCPKCGKQFKTGTDETVEAVPAEVHASEESKSEATEKTPSTATIDSGKKGMTNPLPVIFIVLLLIAAVVGGIIYFTQSGAAKPTFDDIKLPIMSGKPAETQEEQKDTWSVEKATNSVLYLEVYDDTDNIIATASGFVFNNRTTVVTNYHVIDGAHHIRAYPTNQPKPNNQAFSLSRFYLLPTVLAYDENADLALLKCGEDMGVPPIPSGDSILVKQGDAIYTDGYPLGLANTLTDGLISSRYIDENGIDTIQISAPISSGSSGGALLDKDGNVIGVTCASYVDGQNLNLAIPISYVEKLLNRQSPKPLSDFFIPTYSVEYVRENYDELIGKTFYVYGWVSAYYDGIWIHIYNSAEEVPYKNTPNGQQILEEINQKNPRYITLRFDEAGITGPFPSIDTGDCLLSKVNNLFYFDDDIHVDCIECSIIG